MLVSHVLVPPAMRLILDSPSNRVQGFIAPGHVCTVMGYSEYEELVRQYRVPIVVGGFEPVDLLEAIHMLVSQLEEGRAEMENQYARSVSYEGNRPAQQILREVFEVADRKWRGIGEIESSGYRLREEFAAFDAERLFRSGGNGRGGARGVHQRAGAARAQKAGRLSRLRLTLHADDASGRADGVGRRRLRGLLPIPPPCQPCHQLKPSQIPFPPKSGALSALPR